MLVLLAVIAGLLLSSRRSRLPGVFLAFYCWTAFLAVNRLDDRWPSTNGQQDVALYGWIDGFPDFDERRAIFTLRTFSESAEQIPRRIRLSWYDQPQGLVPGMSLSITARITTPHGLANPGGFDYEKWLFTQSIGATGYVREGVLDPERRFGLAQDWLEFRAGIAERIRNEIDDAVAAGLVIALAIGVKTDFGEVQWEALRRTGTSHLVAISGLHVGLVAGFAFQFLLKIALWLPYRFGRNAWALAATFSIFPAAAYAALAGFSLPTLRALLMLIVLLVVIVSRRRVAPSLALALALLAILVTSPLATLDPSFWLSFGAVAVIALVAYRARQRPSAKPRGNSLLTAVRGLIQVQVAVIVGLMPLAAVYFGEISISAFVVNLVAIPFFSVIMVPASLIMAISVIIGMDAHIVGAVVAWLAESTWIALEAAARLEYAAIDTAALSHVGLAVAAAGAIAFLTGPPRKRYFALLALLPLFLRIPERLDDGSVSLTVLDVGHGLAVIVRTRSHTLLYDTGPISRTGFDAGREVVLPALDSLGLDKIDTIMVSHGDSDHAGGLSSVVARYPGARLLHGPDIQPAMGQICEATDAWVWDQVAFSVVHPVPGYFPLGNDSSCVLRVDSSYGSALLTGDIERRAENLLAVTGIDRAEIVVVPHHGSATSSTKQFVEAVSPLYAIVSAGFANRWSFPRPNVVDRWLNEGAVLLTTGDVGAVTASISAAGIVVRGERSKRIRYWQVRSAQLPGTSVSSAL
jgi:competence protein ComEC